MTYKSKIVAASFIFVAIGANVGIVLAAGNATPSGPVKGLASKCLDNNGALVKNKNKIQLYTCNNTKAQNVSFPSDGTMRIQGYCVDVTGASKAVKTAVQLYKCNGTVAQKWVAQSNNTLVNPNSGLCLDVQAAKTANKTQIWMDKCSGNVSQRWTLPYGVVKAKPPVAVAPTPKPTPAPVPTPTPTPQPLPNDGVCNPLPTAKVAPATLRNTSKKVFAYYFPPFPVSIDNKAPSSDSWSKWVNSYNSIDGAYDLRDRQIGRAPWSRSDFKQADFEVEVRRAIEVGIDGFNWEWKKSSSDIRWNQLPAMLAAAKVVDPGFKIQLSPDFPTNAGATPDSTVEGILEVANHPSVYRLADGRIPLSPYYPERQPVSFWKSLVAKLEAKGVKVALVPIFGSWNGSATDKKDWDAISYGYSVWGGRAYSSLASTKKQTDAAHARGKIWMQSVAFEDTRSYDGRFWESANSSALREGFTTALANNAEWVNIVAWNDYTESWVSPSQERGYAVTDVASYYIQWYKTGKAPAVTQDALYWFHRSHPTDAPSSKKPIGRKGQPVTMKVADGTPAENEVELVAFLKSPGVLTIKQGSNIKTMNASAGAVSFKVPMVTGTTPVFTLTRDNKTVHTITSDTPIKASVTYQDMIYHAGGNTVSNCKRP